MSRVTVAAGVFALVVLIAGTMDDILTRVTKTFLPYVGAVTGVRPADEPLPPSNRVPHFE
jgi:hypothetical protein